MWPRRASSALALIVAAVLGSAPVLAQPRRFSFMPNQLAANAWYRPGTPPSLINGHLDESFGRAERWPRLRTHLRRLGGSFSCGAAEVGWLDSRSGLLPLLRAEGIPLAVELPGFTQCIDGAELAEAELNGARLRSGDNLFAKVFRLDTHDGHGWFVTRDGQPLVPDELLFDERIPNLLPTFDADKLATTPGTWAQRKDAARQPNGCAPLGRPFADYLARLMDDYVAYLRVARAKWGPRMPEISLHWNVNPGWEWRDEPGIDAVQAADPTWLTVPANFWGIVAHRPQYNSVRYLGQLLDRLAAAGFRPRTVYMDVDWTYNILYILEVLRRHAADLRQRGVQLGINVVEASIGDQDELHFAAHTLTRRTVADATPNALYESTLRAIVALLDDAGLNTPDVVLRVGSWSHRPYEQGDEVDEARPGSLAHCAVAIADAL